MLQNGVNIVKLVLCYCYARKVLVYFKICLTSTVTSYFILYYVCAAFWHNKR